MQPAKEYVPKKLGKNWEQHVQLVSLTKIRVERKT